MNVQFDKTWDKQQKDLRQCTLLKGIDTQVYLFLTGKMFLLKAEPGEESMTLDKRLI